ncbi:MAG: lysophospholipid acyltransferase family protein [Mycoplasmoidaceae bacterium]
MKKIVITIINRIAWIFRALTILRHLRTAKYKVKEYENNPLIFTKVERYELAYKTSYNAIKLFNISIDAKGMENIPKRPVLFVSNHKSNFDSIILIKILFELKGYPFFNFIAKHEVKNMKYASSLSRLIDSIFIDRLNPRDILNVFNDAKKKLLENSVIVFPEGTRIKGNLIGEMKSAVLEPAYKAMVPIIPVVIYGTNLCQLEKEKRPNYRYKKITVEFLPQIKPKDFINIKREFLMEKISLQINNKYKEIDNLDNQNTIKKYYQEK